MLKTLRVPKGDWDKLRKLFEKLGYTLEETPHSLWSFRKENIKVSLYPSGVLVVEGKNTTELYQRIIEEITPMDVVEVGCDESGKGDVFGPLVVCCAIIKPENYKKVLEIAPRDSKALKDDTLIKKTKELEKLVEHKCEVLEPKVLNLLYLSAPNLNRVLDEFYKKLIGQIRNEYSNAKVYVDAYSHTNPFGPSVIFQHKGEDHISVSVASMLARTKFLKWLIEHKLPKGSSKESIRLAKEIYNKDKERAKGLLKMFFLE